MTRNEAMLAGLTRYNTGKPCVYGHMADRMTTTHNCVECNRNRQRNGNGSPKAKITTITPWKEPAPRILIDIDPQRHSRQGTRLANVYVDDTHLFAMVVKSHSAEQVAARLVAQGYEDGPVDLRYGDVLGRVDSLHRLAGKRPTAAEEFNACFIAPLAAAVRNAAR